MGLVLWCWWLCLFFKLASNIDEALWPSEVPEDKDDIAEDIVEELQNQMEQDYNIGAWALFVWSMRNLAVFLKFLRSKTLG
ncbi:hypothetical protein LOK49_LG08G00487 [Camellia lanceoleosa]|uniref:Uncharacterized protein n=1 Tax=Camellia lanceoleosa TaxID=1840588 RepID=A0ACC0GPN9_9ERIC|nr:hypothetical protein LOK49_LG08G00487 [Camellia lanceoleosa]